MKKEELFLEDNGHYWISVHDDEPEIGKYGKDANGFYILGGNFPYDVVNCKVLSKLILRPTE